MQNRVIRNTFAILFGFVLGVFLWMCNEWLRQPIVKVAMVLMACLMYMSWSLLTKWKILSCFSGS